MLVNAHFYWPVHIDVGRALHVIVDLCPSNQPRCHQTHLAHVQPTSLSLNPLCWCPTHLAGVQPACLVSLASCWIQFVIVESSSSLWNLVCCGIWFVVTKSSSSWWNPFQPRIHVLWLWWSSLQSRQIRFVVVESASLLWNLHRRGETCSESLNPLGRGGIRYGVIESSCSSSKLLHHGGIRFVIVESAYLLWNPLRRLGIRLAVIEPILPSSNTPCCCQTWGGGWKLWHCGNFVTLAWRSVHKRSVGWMRGRIKRTATFLAVRIRDVPSISPSSWVPLPFLLPNFLRWACINRPHPSGKGRGGVVGFACRARWSVSDLLREGRGSWVSGRAKFWWWRRGRWWGWDEGEGQNQPWCGWCLI